MRLKTLIICLAAAILTACATGGGTKRSEIEMAPEDEYLQYDLGSVSSINYFGRFDGWRPVGRDKLLLWDGVDRAHLITVAPPCYGLETTNMISFSTRVRGSITSNLDSVLLPGESCRITEIRRIDLRKMKEDKRKREEQ